MLADLGDGEPTVGAVGGVPDVDDVLVGQQVDDRARDRQAADSGIEDPDGRGGVGTQNPTPDDGSGCDGAGRLRRSRLARYQAAAATDRAEQVPLPRDRFVGGQHTPQPSHIL